MLKVILCIVAAFNFYSPLVWAQQEESAINDVVENPVPQTIDITIPLSYPQKTNAPVKVPVKLKPTVLVKGKIIISVENYDTQQASPDAYIEYFLNGALVYSNEGGKPLEFRLDTRAYPNGQYELIVNLWDPHGPSAIGKSKIELKND